MNHKMIAPLLHVPEEEKQAEKWEGHQRSSTQGEKLPKKTLTAPLPVCTPQSIQTRAKGLEVLFQAQMPGGTHSLLSLCEDTHTASEDQSRCSDTAPCV